MHIETPHAKVTQEGIQMAYKICCPSDDCYASSRPSGGFGIESGSESAEETVPKEAPEEPNSKVIVAPDAVEETDIQGQGEGQLKEPTVEEVDEPTETGVEEPTEAGVLSTKHC